MLSTKNKFTFGKILTYDKLSNTDLQFTQKCECSFLAHHNDVMTWKHSLNYWSFVSYIHQTEKWWIPLERVSHVELLFSLLLAQTSYWRKIFSCFHSLLKRRVSTQQVSWLKENASQNARCMRTLHVLKFDEDNQIIFAIWWFLTLIGWEEFKSTLSKTTNRS